jgi:uncharacterized membrane-anchored protein YhcB (DUF1043 family)
MKDKNLQKELEEIKKELEELKEKFEKHRHDGHGFVTE